MKSFLGIDNMPRGVRNNNPGNIKLNTNNAWHGKLLNNVDGVFEQFDFIENGVRAAAKLIVQDYNDGKKTVRALINEWAPVSENNTQSYIAVITDRLGVGPDDDVNLDLNGLKEILKAIFMHENGFNENELQRILTDQEIIDSIKLLPAALWSALVSYTRTNPVGLAAVVFGILFLIHLLNSDHD